MKNILKISKWEHIELLRKSTERLGYIMIAFGVMNSFVFLLNKMWAFGIVNALMLILGTRIVFSKSQWDKTQWKK